MNSKYFDVDYISAHRKQKKAVEELMKEVSDINKEINEKKDVFDELTPDKIFGDQNIDGIVRSL